MSMILKMEMQDISNSGQMHVQNIVEVYTPSPYLHVLSAMDEEDVKNWLPNEKYYTNIKALVIFDE